MIPRAYRFPKARKANFATEPDRRRDILAVGEREGRESGKVRPVQGLLGCTPKLALDSPKLARAGFGYDVMPSSCRGRFRRAETLSGTSLSSQTFWSCATYSGDVCK